MWTCPCCGQLSDDELAKCHACGAPRDVTSAGERGDASPPLDPIREVLIELRTQREVLEIIHGRVGCPFAFLIAILTLIGMRYLFYALVGLFSTLRQ